MTDGKNNDRLEGKAKAISLGSLLLFSVSGTIADLVLVSLIVIAGDSLFGPEVVNLGVVIGIAQLGYKVPLYVWARIQGHENFARVLICSAVLTFMLNAGCWGLVAVGQFRVY